MSQCEAGEKDKPCPNVAEYRPVIRFIMKPASGHVGKPRNQDLDWDLKVCRSCTHRWHLEDFWSDRILELARVIFRKSGAKEPTKADAQLVWLPIGQSMFDKMPPKGETK